MPFYEYRPAHTPGCQRCHSGLVILQKLNAPALSHCPDCGVALIKIISAPNVPTKGQATLSASNIEKAGFTQYKKIGQGVYEKTAGRGPNVIGQED